LGKINFFKLLEKSGYLVHKDNKIKYDLQKLNQGYNNAGKPIKSYPRPWIPKKEIKLNSEWEIDDESDDEIIYR